MEVPTVVEYRWLLPATLAAGVAVDRPPRRSTRDWVIDGICFALGAGFALLATADLLSDRPTLVPGYQTDRWVVWLDLVVGLAVAAALWWRRRWPVGVLLAATPASLYSVTSAVSLMIMLFTVAVHRRFVVVAVTTGLTLLYAAVYTVLRPDTTTSFGMSMAWTATFIVVIVLWGMVVRSRRLLVVSLRDRADRAESEQQLRVAQARALERTRIAREMHDVLAHRISLLSLHAGALEIRPDAAPDDVARAAGVIRASAHQALQDLRQVIGVLREPTADQPVERPQPTLVQLPALLDESRDAGVTIGLSLAVDTASSVPDDVGRAAYRIVQEGLTNARKHAPGADVTVTVAGSVGTGLTIEISNAAAGPARAPALPGAGTGLIGLAERATLAGGHLRHGRDSSGVFTLAAWLPWPG